MPFNPEFTARVVSYIPKDLHDRMKAVQRKKGWLNVSAQIELSLLQHLPTLEKLHNKRKGA